MSKDDKSMCVNEPSFQIRFEKNGIYIVNPEGEGVAVERIVRRLQEFAVAVTQLGLVLEPLAGGIPAEKAADVIRRAEADEPRVRSAPPKPSA